MKDIKFIAMCKDIFMIIKINIYEIIFGIGVIIYSTVFLLFLTFQFLHNICLIYFITALTMNP